MAINPNLLISAAMMQDVFVDDATGTAMAGGVITMYQDNSRSLLKNWYYQTGSPGAYTYLPLANPLTLSAAGTITDPYGNDTIPFYYPYSETDNTTAQPYFVTVFNANGQAQFTRQNFPFNVVNSGTATSTPTLNNLIINSAFYHNIEDATYSTASNHIIAPGAWDGFIAAGYDGIRFFKSSTSTDQISFIKFPPNSPAFTNDTLPEYYLNVQCTVPTTGETVKCVNIPINLHQQTLQGLQAVLTFQAQNANIASSGVLTININQYNGTGASPQQVVIPITTVSTSSSWTKYTVPILFPSTSSTLSATEDDTFTIQIQYPLNAAFSINIAVPQLYLGSTVPTNFFQTYDEIDTFLADPRTGDIRVSLNSYSPYGWVPLNDGTIGSVNSGASTRNNFDTWQLFYLIWTTFQGNQSLAPMFTSTGTPIAYGADPAADFTGNRRLSLTKTLGRALCSVGLASSGGSTTFVLGQAFGEQNHTQTLAELVPHTHLVQGGGNDAGPSSYPLFFSDHNDLNEATTSTGSGTAFNVTQPSIFYNVFMKL